MHSTICEVVYRPETEALRFLPEGPYNVGKDRLSWVAIQHGPEAAFGSLNLLSVTCAENTSYTLPGRPGFAFPTDQPNLFLVGAERSLGLFDTTSDEWRELATGIDADVTNTIINDGVIYDGSLIFGCKDLEFATPKAGLYLWRRKDQKLIQLKRDQLCSNGKAVVQSDGNLWLYDIDSPTKRITRSILDIEAGTLAQTETVVDLSSEEVFPDGLVLTPDHQSLIVAIYNPADAEFGEARQYGLADGPLQAIWKCPGAAQVTCPQLFQNDGEVDLILTSFRTAGDQPVFPAGELI